jgi:sugar phosphate isomerase/epimerase
VIAYCTNVHPAPDLAGILAQLDRYAVRVREALEVDTLPLGLWLPAPVARGLAEDRTARQDFRAELTARGLTVSTLNAFPYGDFHDEVVKHAVYFPTWSDRRRLQYTMDCATVLADLLPDSATYGSISTLPLSWREPWTLRDEGSAVAALTELTRFLHTESGRHGRAIRLAVEPEPGCVLEMTGQAAAWLNSYSSPNAGASRIGLGFDTCHLAVQFEEPADAFETLWRAGVDVVKAQLSAAPQLVDPSDMSARRRLADLGDPKYLRQVREWCGPGVDDVEQAYQLSGHAAWRMHAHVPAHCALSAPLSGTNGVLEDCLTRLVGGGQPLTHHLESETYAWTRKPRTTEALAKKIAKELAWLRDRLTRLGLDPV